MPFSLASTSLADSSLGKNKIVRSTRRSKQRKVSKSKVVDEDSYLTRKSNVQGRLCVEKKLKEGFDENDPLRLFLRGPESKQLLTLVEETQLIAQLQVLLRIPYLILLNVWYTQLRIFFCHNVEYATGFI